MTWRAGRCQRTFGAFEALGLIQRKKTGRIVDAYQGSCRRGLGNWCKKRHLQITKRFGLLESEEEGALAMAQEWFEKIEFLYKKCLAAGDMMLKVSQAVLDLYIETPKFVELASVVDTPHKQEEVMWLRALNLG